VFFWGVWEVGESVKKSKGGRANRPSPQSPKGILGSRPPTFRVQAISHF
jgi:hypothetical protein